MKCASYTRSIIKFGTAISITEQNEKIAAFLKGRRMIVEQKYSDRKEDISADEGFNEMKEAGINRQFECIVFWSMSYFGKDPLIGYDLLRHVFIPAGIDFAVASDNFISVGHSAEEIDEYLDSKYSERRRVYSQTLLWRAAEGRMNTLYGYERHGNEFSIDEEVAPVVREILELGFSGKPVREICSYLNQKGIESPQCYLRRVSGRSMDDIEPDWQAPSVKKILTDKRYMGVRQIQKKGVIEEVSIEPYISEEKYNKIQTFFRTQKRSSEKVQSVFGKKIFDKDSHLRLHLGSYNTKGGKSYFLSKNYPGCEQYKKRSLHSDIVEREALLLLNREIAMAKQIKSTMESDCGKAEIALQLRNMQEALESKLQELLDRIDSQELLNESLIESDEAHAMDKELTELIAKKQKAERTFLPDNPWVELYSSYAPIEKLTEEVCNDLVEEVLLERFEKVILVPKYHEWKECFPDYWKEI